MKNIDWLIGVVIGDGRISDRYIRVYNNDEAIIQKCKLTFDKKFGIKEPKVKTRKLSKNRNGFLRNKETVEITINSTELVFVFNKLSKRFLKNPTKDFINGLFDAEGSIDLRGTVTFWQRKNIEGEIVTKSVKKWLQANRIKFTEIRNSDFFIVEILGSYKNYLNIQKFLNHVKFTAIDKVKDAKLILDIFCLHSTVSKGTILNFVESQNSTTVRNVVETFKIPKMNAYTALNKLVRDNRITKTKTYPNYYIFSR